MSLQELLKKYLTEENKVTEFLNEMKTNKIYTSNEENIDIRYGKLKEDFDSKDKEHKEATTLIEQLKSSSKGNEDLQSKIDKYEKEIIPKLEKEKEEIKIESALHDFVLESKATDIDYITHLIKEKIKDIKLDDNGKIKGIEDTLKDIKTAKPNFFKIEDKKQLDVKELGKGKEAEQEPKNLAEAMAIKYQEKIN